MRGRSRLLARPALQWPIPQWESSAVSVAASGTPHASGAWTELVASSSSDVQFLLVSITGMQASATITSGLLDLGLGGSGAEVALLTSLPAGYSSGVFTYGRVGLAVLAPVFVPSGSRISARLQAEIASDTASIAVEGLSSPFSPPSTIDTLGAVTGASRGTNMPTSDAYVEIAASTARAYQALIVLPAGAAAASMAGESSVYTVAVGSAGSETPLGATTVATTASEVIGKSELDVFSIFPASIPAGSRIACKQSIGRNYRDVIILGVPVS